MKKVVLCILDGVGVNKENTGNAVKNAKTPYLDYMFEKYSNCLLNASGLEVGLPENQMGNSEVGHMNIGAGRIVYQLYERINQTIKENKLEYNKNLINIINHVKKNNSTLHISGLISNGGVHSHINHILEVIKICKRNKVNLNIHIITDGRDTDVHSSYLYIQSILNLNYGKIVSISGRFYAMDRNKNYDRIYEYYKCLIGTQATTNLSIKEYIDLNYQTNITDEYIKPILFSNDGIKDNDAFLFLNYRADRSRQIMEMLSQNNNEYKTKNFKNILLVTMTKYKQDFPFLYLFENTKVINPLGKILADNNLKQCRIAETEKYAHVTYYFDGGEETDYKNCEKILIPSKNNYSYDMSPKMSAIEINKCLIKKIEEKENDFILVNFANGDMVGHTGNYKASLEAMETIDDCLKIIDEKCKLNNYTLLVTADHGNCEEMIDINGNILTAHTTNPVLFIINDTCKLKNGKLGDIAPTVLKLLNIPKPSIMNGSSIISDNN